MKFLSALLTQASGSLGGATSASNRGGNYFRARVAPTQPRTVAQQAVRATLASISSSWKALTAAQIAGWNTLASGVTLKDSLGNSYKPSGAQLYLALNANLLNIGASTITSSPAASPDFSDLGAITATAAAGTPAFTVTTGLSAAPTGFTILVEATAQFSPGKSYVGLSQYRVLEHFASSAYASLNILAAYNAKFGTLVAGNKVGLRVRLISSTAGWSSIAATGVATIGA